ncbi:MAG: hypothetical protein A3B68_03145 [Candidatus Melainabacteria bacterium RIFCSPHIGHO2_02_FULL_34_12]|nr:MAG: hypothetical protein A3B68_03145 [Candidatus Melainabacteria bacterium RIFCSPHIGHO2_02_FULL_34_12]
MGSIILFKKPDKSARLKFKFNQSADLVEITDHSGSTVQMTVNESEDIFHAIFQQNKPKCRHKH